MNKSDLLKLAQRYLIADDGSSMTYLVRKIQLAEGHRDCFATGKRDCEQMACRWRPECLSGASEYEPDGTSNSDLPTQEKKT